LDNVNKKREDREQMETKDKLKDQLWNFFVFIEVCIDGTFKLGDNKTNNHKEEFDNIQLHLLIFGCH